MGPNGVITEGDCKQQFTECNQFPTFNDLEIVIPGTFNQV